MILLDNNLDSIEGGQLAHHYHNVYLGKEATYDMSGLQIKNLGFGHFLVDKKKMFQDEKEHSYRFSNQSFGRILFVQGKIHSFSVTLEENNMIHIEGLTLINNDSF